nr:MAG: hypothetical protein [Microvirus sp.]
MDFRKRKKRDRVAAIALVRAGKTRAKAGLPLPQNKIPPKFRSNGPLADRLSRAFARNVKKSTGDMATPGAGRRSSSFVYARRSSPSVPIPDRFDPIDRSGRRATFTQRKAWAERVASESPERVARRNDVATCKERPQDSRKKRGAGPSRAFIPWCK